MAWKENEYGREQLVGNVDLPLVAQPTIRGSIRRNDPDGSSSTPYYPGLSGLTLLLSVDTTPYSITFSSNDYQTAITTINTIAGADVLATDTDGVITITALHSGSQHFMTITGGTSLTVLGFEQSPVPGSSSYAGELATAPLGGSQANREGTALHTHGENYISSVINRAIYGSLLKIERYLKDYEKDLSVVVTLPVTVSTHPIAGKSVFYLTDDAVNHRLCQGHDLFGIGVTNPTALQIDPIASIQDANNSDMFITGSMGAGPVGLGTPGDKIRIGGIFYGTSSTPLSNGSSFAAWGTPDGKSIFGTSVPQLTKTSATITSIRGNVLVATGALFLTNKVKPGDIFQITGATNVVPFAHNGEFVVEAVFDENTISVRGMGDSEDFVYGTNQFKPTKLNAAGGGGYGTITVPVGNYIPATSLVFELTENVTPGSYNARLLVGRRLRDLQTDSITRDIKGDEQIVAHALWDHINRTAHAHPATAIDYAGGPNWLDGTTNPAANVDATFDSIINDLIAQTAAHSGGHKIGAALTNSVTFPSLVYLSLAAGTVKSQIDTLLVDQDNHLQGLHLTGNRHPAGDVDYGGGPSSPVSVLSSLPPQTVEAIIDSLINILGNRATGAGFLNYPNIWSVIQHLSNTHDSTPAFISSDVPSASSFKPMFAFPVYVDGSFNTVYLRLLAGSNGEFVATINANWVFPNWQSDSHTNTSSILRAGPTALILQKESATSSPWSDSAWSNTGFEFDFTSSSLIGGIAYALKLGTALLGSSSNATIPRLSLQRAFNGTAVRTLLIDFPDPSGTGQHVRVFRSDADTEALEITYNANWSNGFGGFWFADVIDSSTSASLLTISRHFLTVSRRVDTTAVDWFDTNGSTGWADGRPAFQLNWSSDDDAYNTFYANALTAKNMKKAWVLVHASFAGVSLLDGFNVSSVSLNTSTGILTVNLACTLASTTYGVGLSLNDVFDWGSDTGSNTVLAAVPTTVNGSKTTTSFQVQLVSTTTGLNATMASPFLGSIMIEVMGVQST